MRSKVFNLTESIRENMSAADVYRESYIKDYINTIHRMDESVKINSKEDLVKIVESIESEDSDISRIISNTSDSVFESIFPIIADRTSSETDEEKIKEAKKIAGSKEVDEVTVRDLKDKINDKDYSINVCGDSVTLNRGGKSIYSWKVKKIDSILEEEVPASEVDFFHSELQRIDDKIRAVSDMKAEDPENDYYSDLLKAYDSEREIVIKAIEEQPVETETEPTESPEMTDDSVLPEEPVEDTPVDEPIEDVSEEPIE